MNPEQDFTESISFITDHELDETKLKKFIAEFTQNLNALDFSSLNIISIENPTKYDLVNNYFLEDIQKKTVIAGVEKIEMHIVFTTFMDAPVAFYLDTICYNGKWYMYALGRNTSQLFGVQTLWSGVFYNTDEEQMVNQLDSVEKFKESISNK